MGAAAGSRPAARAGGRLQPGPGAEGRSASMARRPGAEAVAARADARDAAPGRAGLAGPPTPALDRQPPAPLCPGAATCPAPSARARPRRAPIGPRAVSTFRGGPWPGPVALPLVCVARPRPGQAAPALAGGGGPARGTRPSVRPWPPGSPGPRAPASGEGPLPRGGAGVRSCQLRGGGRVSLAGFPGTGYSLTHDRPPPPPLM